MNFLRGLSAASSLLRCTDLEWTRFHRGGTKSGRLGLYCTIYIQIFLITVQILKTSRGKPLLALDGYTFYKIGGVSVTNWRCTSNLKCRAKVSVDESHVIVRGDLVHTHERPRFFIDDGIAIKF